MPFEKGNRVFIRSLGKAGRVVLLLKVGRYQISVGDLIVECQEKDLKLASPFEDDDDLPKYVSARRQKQNPPRKTTSTYQTVDLHGFTGPEAASAVKAAVNAALMAQCDSLQIIHGLGSGKVKEVVHATLAKLSVVKKFRLDEENAGVTWVYF
jgi:DNA mismatch repair protein MutS2